MRRLIAETMAAALALAAMIGGCTAVLGLDDKVFVDEENSVGATGVGGAGGGGQGGEGGKGGSGGGGGAGGTGGAGGGCSVIPAAGDPGQSLWLQTSTSSQAASVTDVAVDGCGAVWVIAKFAKDIQLGDCPLRTSFAGSAILWAKLDGATGACIQSGVLGGATNGDLAEPTAIATDAAGNVVIAGAFKGFLDAVDSSLSSEGSFDPFLVRLDSAGNLLWMKAWQSTIDDGLSSAAIDPTDGSIVVAGSIAGSMVIDTSTETPLMSNSQSSDILVVKINKDGFSQWGHAFGTPGYDAAHGVSIRTPSGAIGLTGTFNGPLTILGKSITSIDKPDVFAAALNAAGTVCSFGFSALADPSARGTSVAWTGTLGQLAVVGDFQGGGSFEKSSLQTNSGDTDSFVALLDTTGGLNSSATRIGQALGGPMGMIPDRLLAIAALPGSSDVIVAGAFRDTVTVGGSMATSAGGDDILVARLGQTFKAAWARSIGDMADQEARAAAVDPGSGAPVIGGTFGGTVNFGVGSPISALTPQAFVLKLAP